MRYFLILLVGVALFTSCSVIKDSQDVSSFDYDIYSDVVVELSEEDKRKFDYYFFEGNRYKAINEPNKSFMYFAEALEIDTTCSACAYELSRILLSNENIDEAENLMEKAVRYSPDNRYYVTLLSRIYQNNDKGEKAVMVGERLLGFSDPSSLEDLYFVAQLQIENKMYDSAISNLNQIESRIGVNEGLTFEIFRLYIENNDLKNAQRELEKLIQEYPTNGDYHVYLGDFFLQNKDYKRAFGQYNKALEVQPDNGKVYFSLANYHINRGDTVSFKKELLKGFKSGNVEFENKFRRFIPLFTQIDDTDNPVTENEAIEIFEILIDRHPFQVELYRSYGGFLVNMDKLEEARSIFERGLEVDASQPALWQEYLMLLSDIGDNKALVAKSSLAVTFFPEEAFFRLFQGVSLFQTDELKKSADTLEKGLNYIKDNPQMKGQFHSYLGDIYHSMGVVEKSFEHYEEALKIDENNIFVLNNYSYYLALEGLNLDRAERMSAKTVELEPGNSTYLDTYAWVLFKKKRFTEAKFIIERAIDNLEEPSGVIYEHYGDILFKTGNITGAIEQWEKAAEMDDHSDLLKEKLEKREYIDGK